MCEMATWAIGDIHGEKALLVKLLKWVGRNDSDPVFIFLGDYVGRGSDSFGVIETLISLKESDERHIFLMGNWDYYFCLSALSDSQSCSLNHSFREMIPEKKEKYFEFMSKLNARHISGNFLFSHAPIPDNIPIWDLEINDYFCKSAKHFNSYNHVSGLAVVCGHSRRSKPTVIMKNARDAGLVMVDTGCGIGYSLTAVNIDSLASGKLLGLSANRFKSYYSVFDIVKHQISLDNAHKLLPPKQKAFAFPLSTAAYV